MASDTYQIYAVKYAHHDRQAHENFLRADPHETGRCRSIISSGRWSARAGPLLDTGFDEAMARKRGREFITRPATASR